MQNICGRMVFNFASTLPKRKLSRSRECLRNLCATQINEKNTSPTAIQKAPIKEEEWRIIYRLKIMPWAAALSRVKIYHGIVTAGGTPIAFALETSGQLSPGVGLTFLACGVSTLITLSVASWMIKDLVGFVYVNKTAGLFKLSYIDFWGRRQNLSVDIDDIMSSRQPNKLAIPDYYQTICFKHNGRLKLKFLPRFGNVHDVNSFNLFISLF